MVAGFLLEDIEDTGKTRDDEYKLYGMTPDGMMGRYGDVEEQAIGFSCLAGIDCPRDRPPHGLDPPRGNPVGSLMTLGPSSGLVGRRGRGRPAFRWLNPDFMRATAARR
jgi:hypothetical protein